MRWQILKITPLAVRPTGRLSQTGKLTEGKLTERVGHSAYGLPQKFYAGYRFAS